MNAIELFLYEVCDCKLDNKTVKALVDETDNLKLSRVLSLPVVKSGVLFRFMWNRLFGTWPSRNMTRDYLLSCPKSIHSSHVDVNQFMSFVKERVVVTNYLPVDIQGLVRAKDDFASQLDEERIKHHIIEKICFRFGVEHERLRRTGNLYIIMSKCIQSPTSWAKVTDICHQLACQQKKEPYPLGNAPNTLAEYFDISKQINDYYELDKYNPFNGSYCVNPFVSDTYTTVFDAINTTVGVDSDFIRHLSGSISICCCSPFAQQHNRLKNLVHAANTRDGKRNINVFVMPNTVHLPQSDTFNYMYSFADPYLLSYVPKLSLCCIVIDEHVHPKCPSICAHPEWSIYYTLYRNGNGIEQNLQYIGEDIPIYKNQFNKYVTSLSSYEDLKRFGKLDTDKRMFIIADSCVDNSGKASIVMNDEFVIHQWNAHLSVQCPYTAKTKGSYHPNMNVLLYDQFILYYYMQHKAIIDAALDNACRKSNGNRNSNRDSPNAILVIDNRPNIFSVISVFVSLANLQPNMWHIEVVCNNANLGFFQSFFGDVATYHTHFSLPVKKFSLDCYNDLLKSGEFWKTFECYERLLLVQDDGLIVAPGMEEIFIGYDYVGAPWTKEWATINPNKHLMEEINSEMVGNGGLSLRNPKAMLRIASMYGKNARQLHYDYLQQQPEDVFFSAGCVKEKMSVPTYSKAQLFSTEQVCNKKAFGFHKPWPYHDLHDIERMFNSYLDKKLFS